MKEISSVQEVKQNLVDIALKLLRAGLVSGTWGNASARLSTGTGYELLTDESCIAITPSGLSYDSMNAEDIVIITASGKKVSGEHKPSSEYPLHLAIYAAREEVNAIVHTHSPYCTALSIAREKIPPACEDMVQIVGGEVPVAEYAFPGTEKLGHLTVSAMEGKMAVLMSNHGLVACGRSLNEAYKTAAIVEKSAMATIYASFIGKIHPIPREDIEKMRAFYRDEYSQEFRDT